ncbi:MAG: sodium:proton antiporter NhaD [Saprospiraceae bacterium]|nr:sodium:proton antiporter NhaD [Saprospiraceae bacterium]
MYALIIVAFIVGYTFIALEHVVKVDKAATAIITGVICWTLMVYSGMTFFGAELAEAGGSFDLAHHLEESLLHHVGDIAEILFFLLAAMTIVELIDSYQGFNLVTDSIRTTHKVKLMWMVCFVTFFLSALLDNLTTTIVIATLLRKLIKEKDDLWFYGGMVVLAANAGGAWSPIGDVTTIMLWIGGQISALSIVQQLLAPSIICLLVPLIILSFTMKGELERPEETVASGHNIADVTPFEQRLIFIMGIGGLLFVPVFKNITHLPPFMGMLGSLSVLWITTEVLHRNKSDEDSEGLMVGDIIRRIDTPSILFFLGILLAVAGLQTTGILLDFAHVIDKSLGNIYLINLTIGLLSSIVDNVPLVAGAMGMYSLDTYPQDHHFWELLAYCAGTGGSVLIIGSAAGVAMMGILRINFIWYLKKLSLLALVGYLAGLVFLYLTAH